MFGLAKVSEKLAHADLNQRVWFERTASFHYGAEVTTAAQPSAHRSHQFFGWRFQKFRVRIARIRKFSGAIDQRPPFKGRGDLQVFDTEHTVAGDDIRDRNRGQA